CPALGLEKLRLRTGGDKMALASLALAGASRQRGREFPLQSLVDRLRGADRGRVPKQGEKVMTIKVGDRLPAGSLSEYVEVETAECKIGPNEFKVDDLTRGKKVVLFGLPGAFTPTCSAKHVPSYLANYDKLKAKGVDTIACMAVNDAFVMGAWGREQKTDDKIRMLADGSGDYTKALGLEFDLSARGLGVRCQRFSMLVDDGVVKKLNIEAPGKYEVSDAETMLKQLG